MLHSDLLETIPRKNKWMKIHPISKGWSLDKKFYIENETGKSMLLRITDASLHHSKQQEYENMNILSKLSLRLPYPLDFGKSNDNTHVYLLYSWIEGEDAEAILPTLSKSQQYEFGIEAGKILAKIHSHSAPHTLNTWEQKYSRKIQAKITEYRQCGIEVQHDAEIIDFLNSNLHLLANRPQVLQHGDFHAGNMVISQDQKLGLIDFNRMDYGDPWEEFNRIIFSWRVSVPFAVGQIHGYFHNSVPEMFFRLLAVYIATNTIGSLSWALSFGEPEVKVMLKNTEDIVKFYNGFQTHIPLWYQNPQDFLRSF
ncbi:aminoglycoside phosphotransferase family protein [Candidatus Lokiarchaeum ossiferum]|uniref:aminoglycoside phosphotransferase family protein n=1 Tax=Candidatus Lokiarchaeum ossiferum TaxID=2951803 RepID=UPI00352F06F3